MFYAARGLFILGVYLFIILLMNKNYKFARWKMFDERTEMRIYIIDLKGNIFEKSDLI